VTATVFHGHALRVPSVVCHFEDEAEIRDAYWQVQDGDSVIDVGARYGTYSLTALACGARVLAIDAEGQSAVFPGPLQEAAALNGFADRLRVWRGALYDGTPYPPAVAGHTVAQFDPALVAWSTLDEVADGPVDWIKVDVEGAELGVLRGAQRILEAYHPRLVVEDHHRVYEWVRRNRISSQVELLLRSFGYDVDHVLYADRGFMVAS
jgi:FkbM family methyltransferase